MIRLIYKSIQKASKGIQGVTQVTLDTDGTLVELGTVMVKKGSKNFKPILLDGTNLDGKYKTKKQAGGALQRHYNDDKPKVMKQHTPEPVAAAPVEEPKVVEPKPEPVVETIQPAPKLSFTMGDILLDEDFDSGGMPEMPEFLRRDLWTDEEREYFSN